MMRASKAAGVEFDRAWRSAYGRINWPHDTDHRREWKSALAVTRVSWRSAYVDERGDAVEHAVTGMQLVA